MRMALSYPAARTYVNSGSSVIPAGSDERILGWSRVQEVPRLVALSESTPAGRLSLHQERRVCWEEPQRISRYIRVRGGPRSPDARGWPGLASRGAR